MSSRLVLARTSWKWRYDELRWGSNMQARSRRIRDEILGFFRYSSKPAVLNPSPCKKISLRLCCVLTLKRRFIWSSEYAWCRSKSSKKLKLTDCLCSIPIELALSFYSSLLIRSALSFGELSSSSLRTSTVGFFFYFLGSIIVRL